MDPALAVHGDERIDDVVGKPARRSLDIRGPDEVLKRAEMQSLGGRDAELRHRAQPAGHAGLHACLVHLPRVKEPADTLNLDVDDTPAAQPKYLSPRANRP